MDPLNLFGVSEVSQNNFPPPSSRHVLEACEKQDWAALRELVPLPNTIEEPQLSAAELSRMKALRHKQARDTAAESSVDLFGAAVSAAGNAASAASEAGNAASTAASAAAGSLIDTSGRTGTVGKDDVDDQHADVDTGMTALHWIARHGRVGEADYIAPIVELRVEFLALKAAGRAEAGQETEGGAPDAFAFMAAAATSESATSESGAGQEEGAVATLSSTRQRLRRDLSSDELGVWRDLTGATPLHHLAYNPTAQRDASTAQELVAEFCRVTGADVDGVDELGSTAMHTAATTNNSKVVTSLLWIGADPYKVDAYGNTPQLTADLYGHAAISVGLKAVLKRERQLSQSLSVFDEEERGVERSEAFQVAVAHSLETLEEEDEDRSASSSMDTTPPRPSGFSSSPTPAISANSSNSAQGVATAIAPEVAGAAAAAGGQASLADASEQFWDGMSAKLGGDGNGLEGGADPNAASSSSSSSSSWSSRHAESVVEDMQTLAQSLAVLEAKVEYSSAKRLDAAQRLGVLSGNLRRKSAAFSESQEKWAAEEKAFQVEDERRRFERRQGPTTAPVLSFTALNFGLFKDEAEEEAVDKATNDNDDPLSVWQEVARRVSASSELGASFVLSALAEGSAAVGGDNGNDNNKHNFTGGGDSGFSWDGTLKKAHEDGGQQEKEDGDGGNDEETALGRDFLTDSEFKLASELEAQSSALASSISRRDEAAGMAIADYEAQGLREEFNAATFHPSATFRPQGAWAALATLDNTATAGGTRGEGGGGKNGSNELAADATARVFAAEQAHEQAVEKAMETSLMRRLKARTRVGSGAGVEPTSTAFLHAPQATYQARNTATNAASTGGLPRRRQSGARGGYGGDGNGNGDGEVDEDDEEERHARRLLVAAALEAEYVAEKRALRSSVVGGFDYSRLPGGAAKGSGTSSSPSKGVASTTQGKGGASSSSLGKMFGGAGDGVNESGAGSSGHVPRSPLPRGGVNWGEGLESSRAPTDSARLHFLKPSKKQNQRSATSAISGLSIDALAASLTASADVTKRHPGLMKKASQQAALDEKKKAKPGQNKVDAAAAANAASGGGQERKLTKREALVLEALERSRAGKAGTKQGKLSAEAAAEAAEATWRKSASANSSASGASASALAVAELHALDPVRKLSKAARRELREHFDLFVVGQSANGDKADLADPYSLDFMTKKKRQAKEAASISEKDLRILVRSLGWHSLTDSEVGQFCTATTTTAAAAVSRNTQEEGRVLDELIKQNNAAPSTEDEQSSGDGGGENVDQKKQKAGKESSSANGKQAPTKKQLKKGKSDVGDAADAPGAAAAAAAAPTPTTTRTTTTTRKINFQNFLSLLATKTINEAKLSQALRDEFREAFELFVEQDDDEGLGDSLGLSLSATHTGVQQTVSVKAVETVMASLDLKLKANEVAALAANARANAAYRKTKNRVAGGAGGRRGSFVARNGGAAAYLNTAAASAVSATAADGELEASSASLLVDLPTGFRTLALKLQALADEAEAEELAGYELAAEDAILEVGEAEGKAKAVDAEAAGGAFSYDSFMQASQAAALELEKATRKASAAAASASGARQRAFGADGEEEEGEEGEGGEQLEAGGSGVPSAAASALKEAKEAKSKKIKTGGNGGDDDEEDDFSDLVFPNEAKQEALRSEQRLEGFIDAFHAGSEASFEVATARLKALEQQRLQHAVRALKPLLLELELAEDNEKRGNEKEEGGANTESLGGGSSSSSGAASSSSASEGSLYERELAERRQQVEKAASEGFYQLSAMFSGAMGSSGGGGGGGGSGSQAAAAAAAVDQQTVSAPPPENEANRDVQGDAQTDAQADEGGGRGEEEGAPAPSVSLSEEEAHAANGDVWDEVEMAWLGSEEAARREVARAQAWAEDVTRDHLVWYTAEFPNSTYEEWVAAFAPENAREYLAGKQTSVDHRFYFPNAVHLKLWNGAIEASGDAARWHRRVEPRLY